MELKSIKIRLENRNVKVRTISVFSICKMSKSDIYTLADSVYGEWLFVDSSKRHYYYSYNKSDTFLTYIANDQNINISDLIENLFAENFTKQIRLVGIPYFSFITNNWGELKAMEVQEINFLYKEDGENDLVGK